MVQWAVKASLDRSAQKGDRGQKDQKDQKALRVRRESKAQPLKAVARYRGRLTAHSRAGFIWASMRRGHS